MNNLNNPSVNGPHVDRFGSVTAAPYAPFLGDVPIAAVQSAPATVRECAVLDRHARAAFLVVPPAGVTAYTISYGRWVQDLSNVRLGGSNGINQFLVTGSVDVTVADDPIKEVVFDTYTDPVAAFVSAITGAPDPQTTFKLFHRGA